MAKKKSDSAVEKKPTAVVRIEADLVRMLGIISSATGQDVAEIISPLLRSPVERRYSEVVQQLGKELKER